VNETVMVAAISAMGLILSGVLVELVRARRTASTVAEAVATPPGVQSLADLVATTSSDVKALRDTLNTYGTRLAIVERLIEDHLRDTVAGRLHS
jgi:hypothetical protein